MISNFILGIMFNILRLFEGQAMCQQTTEVALEARGNFSPIFLVTGDNSTVRWRIQRKIRFRCIHFPSSGHRRWPKFTQENQTGDLLQMAKRSSLRFPSMVQMFAEEFSGISASDARENFPPFSIVWASSRKSRGREIHSKYSKELSTKFPLSGHLHWPKC